MTRICVFSKTFWPAIGGLETMAKVLATQGVALGYEIEVVTDSPALFLEDDRGQPFEITRTRSFAGRVRAFSRAEVVLSMNVSLHGTIAAAWAQVPIVYSHQGRYRVHGVVRRPIGALKRRMTRLATNICASEFIARDIPGDSVVVHNAYDSDLFRISTGTPREHDFVFCGRLVSDKGVDLCLRALALVRNRGLSSRLTVIGGGPELPALQSLTRKLGLTDAVRFAGSLVGGELSAEMRRHSCLVVSSLWEEPFGIVALEGIACCDTVIVTRRGGLPEAVGGCGLVVEASETELADAMTALARARRVGGVLPGKPTDSQRQAHLAAHSPDRIARQYFRVVEDAIKLQRGPEPR